MPRLSGAVRRIQEAALRELEGSQDGIHFKVLVNILLKKLPDEKEGTIYTVCSYLARHLPDKVYKPERGLYKHTSFRDVAEHQAKKEKSKIPEEDFYEPLAGWLTGALDECTKAAGFGGNVMGKKWGTPDVVGIYKSEPGAVIEFEPELITAEVKVSEDDPITALGQAVAYRLFSNKVYLALPKSLLQSDDYWRVDSLCQSLGIGLVLFDTASPQNPDFEIRVRAQRFTPDMFFLNDFISKLRDKSKDTFNGLFG